MYISWITVRIVTIENFDERKQMRLGKMGITESDTAVVGWFGIAYLATHFPTFEGVSVAQPYLQALLISYM